MATGSGSGRWPYWVHDGARAELGPSGDVRRFATSAAAQRVAERLNRRDYQSAETRSARVHLRAAIGMLRRATDGAPADDPRVAVLAALCDAALDLSC